MTPIFLILLIVLVLILGYIFCMKDKNSLEPRKEQLKNEIIKRINAPSRKELLFRSLMEELKNDIQSSLQCAQSSMFQRIETGEREILSQSNAGMKEIESRISKLSYDVKDMQSALQNLQTCVEHLETIMAKSNQSGDAVRSESQGQGYPYVLYAHMMDSDSPKGFLVSELRKLEKGCVFKLTIQNRDSGIFEFVDDETIHLEILSAFNPVVTETSEYAGSTSSLSRIVVLEPGMLRLNNDVWEIIKKQKVELE